MPPTILSLRSAIDNALEYLLGERCAGCGVVLGTMCTECVRDFAAVTPPPTPDGLGVVSALAYRGAVAHGIRELKTGRTSLARVFASHVADAVATADPSDAVAIVPIPTSARSYRMRGYCVPEVLLRAAHVPPYRALAAVGRRVDQRQLTAEERAWNVAGSIRLRRRITVPERALIFDDVYTTGATLDEAARVLRRAGCEVLGAVTLAHTPRQHPPNNSGEAG